MTHHPYRKVRTRTPRRKQLRDKLHIKTSQYPTLERAIRYDDVTGLFYERRPVYITEKLPPGEYAPTDVTEWENPAPMGRLHKDGYVIIQWRCKSYMAQRLAHYLMVGIWPTGYVRHRNGLRFDNRWVNLMDAKPIDNPNGAGISD